MDAAKNEGLVALTGNEDRSAPKAINGTIAVAPKRVISDEELTKAENELRARAKQLAKQIDSTYWDLGQCLYEVYDGVPGGYRELMKGDGSRQVREGLFKKWGYKSFADYADSEVGIRKRSAENLRYAFYWFEIQLHLPKEVKEKIKSLGRSKVYQLAGFVQEDNIIMWVDKASEMNFEELKKSVKSAKSVGGDKNADNEELDQNMDLSDLDSDEPTPAPKPEEMHTLTTSLYENQWQTWQAALERAKSASGSDKIGHNLELIAQDFLMNNEFKIKGEEDLKALISKFERLIHKKLICIDISSGKPLYGADLLWNLVHERVQSEKEDVSAVDEEDESNVTSIEDGRKRPSLIAEVLEDEEEDGDYDDDPKAG